MKFYLFKKYYIDYTFGCTSFDVQIGRLWFGFYYPKYWLYSSTRKGFGRTWFYYYPMFVRIVKPEDM